jgi:hypothetical protein
MAALKNVQSAPAMVDSDLSDLQSKVGLHVEVVASQQADCQQLTVSELIEEAQRKTQTKEDSTV